MSTTEKATFAAGCFWGIQAAFDRVEGVISSEVGFMGGHSGRADYRQVCTTDTGHAEVVHLTFDSSVVTYQELVDLFWKIHDPTQVDRQGPDVGSQYRTEIFTHSDEQANIAAASKEAASENFSRPIATGITEAGEFYPADEYHQKYLEKRGLSSCHLPG